MNTPIKLTTNATPLKAMTFISFVCYTTFHFDRQKTNADAYGAGFFERLPFFQKCTRPLRNKISAFGYPSNRLPKMQLCHASVSVFANSKANPLTFHFRCCS